MKFFNLLLIFFLLASYSCKNNSQDSQSNFGNTASIFLSTDELVGGYSFVQNGQVEFYIRKNGDEFYVQFGNKAPEREALKSISPKTCSYLLGNDWESKLVFGLELGAFKILKIKTGTLVGNKTITSGYISGLIGAGETWKVE